MAAYSEYREMNKYQHVNITNKNSKYIGLLELENCDGDYDVYDVIHVEDKLVFGSTTNNTFLQDGYMETDECFSLEENLGFLLEALEHYANNRTPYDDYIHHNN